MKKKLVAKVRYLNETKQIGINREKTLLQNLVKAKVPIGRSCNGEGICTTCRVIVAQGELSEPTDLENQRIQERGFEPDERLACQCYLIGEGHAFLIP